MIGSKAYDDETDRLNREIDREMKREALPQIQPGHFVPEPGRKGTPGPYWECWRSECGARKKDHAANGACPAYPKPEPRP